MVENADKGQKGVKKRDNVHIKEAEVREFGLFFLKKLLKRTNRLPKQFCLTEKMSFVGLCVLFKPKCSFINQLSV